VEEGRGRVGEGGVRGTWKLNAPGWRLVCWLAGGGAMCRDFCAAPARDAPHSLQLCVEVATFIALRRRWRKAFSTLRRLYVGVSGDMP
jgi:hypothetical protein